MATRPRRRSVRTSTSRALRIEGLDEFNDALDGLVNAVTAEEMKKVYTEAAHIGKRAIIEMHDRTLTPKTGNYRAAIFAGRGDQAKPSALFGVSPKIAPHSHLVEFGHGGPAPAPPHPVVRPAVAQSARSITQHVVNGLEDIIKRYS
jgi:HK97 gp10 family phage protein